MFGSDPGAQEPQAMPGGQSGTARDAMGSRCPAHKGAYLEVGRGAQPLRRNAPGTLSFAVRIAIRRACRRRVAQHLRLPAIPGGTSLLCMCEELLYVYVSTKGRAPAARAPRLFAILELGAVFRFLK